MLKIGTELVLQRAGMRYAAALALTLACTGAAALLDRWVEPTNLVMIYLLGTTLAALRLGRGPACVNAMAGVAAFDFCFVRPRFTFAVADAQYLITFAVMFVVALTIATLVARVREREAERLRLAEAASQARLERESEALRNTLLASISHDLRTPLAVIAGASSALSDPTLQFDAAQRARLAAGIETKAREMSELVSNVLDLMRYEHGGLALNRDWQSIEEIAALAVERARAGLGSRSVELQLPGDLPPLQVDASLLMQALGNLLDNCIRHTPPHTHIRVGAVAGSGWARIWVEDDGEGLPPGETERLFSKFQHGHKEANTGGAGLGLAICRAVALAHGGEIRASAALPHGARFTIELPLAAPT